MKKIILLVLALINFGFGCMISNAQTEVVEFVIADDWEFERGYREFCLCVMNGNCGKLQFIIPRFGEKCMFDAYAYSYSEDVTIVKLTNPSEDWPSPYFIYLSSRDKYLTDDLTNEYSRYEIREVNIIPKNNWNFKIEEYDMSYVCRAMANASSNSYSNSSSGSYNSNSYNSSNSNTYNSSSSGSELGKAILIGAGIIAAGVAIYDALTDDSSSRSSSSTQKNGFEITDVDISHDAIKQSNGTYWYSDFATVYYKNKNSYSVGVVLLVKLTDGSSFKTQRMIIDPYENDNEGWRSPANKKIKGVDIYSVEKAY